MQFLVVFIAIIIVLILKSYLMKYGFDRKKNIFTDPTYLTEETIKKYKSQGNTQILLKYQKRDFVEKIWAYSFHGMIKAVKEYKEAGK